MEEKSVTPDTDRNSEPSPKLKNMSSPVKDFDELIACHVCNQMYSQRLPPKLLACRHHFCLPCIRGTMRKGMEIFCPSCWQRTNAEDRDDDGLPTYTPVLNLANAVNAGTFTTVTGTSDGSSHNGISHSSAPSSPDTAALVEKDKAHSSLELTCHMHNSPVTMWCHTCLVFVCRVCISSPEQIHVGHTLVSPEEARSKIIDEVQTETMHVVKLVTEAQRLTVQQRNFLLKVHESCVQLKTIIEHELQQTAVPIAEVDDVRCLLHRTQLDKATSDVNDVQVLYSNIVLGKQKLQAKCQDLYNQFRVENFIRNSNVVFDFSLMRHILDNINGGLDVPPHNGQHNPVLFLANYCMLQMYMRQMSSKQMQQQPQIRPPPLQNGGIEYVPVKSPAPYGAEMGAIQPAAPAVIAFNPALQVPPPPNYGINPYSPMFAIFYFNVEINGTPFGRFLVETRPDVAPKMVRNFSTLVTGELGYGYKGSLIFQCWPNESIITGDFEMNNGRGGRSIYEEGFFVPDDTKFPATRGAVGMRRTQKKHDNLGMVGSQFRIILQEMKGFTGIFGHVVEGLDVVEKIAGFGDQAGKANKSIVIASCGKLQ